MSIPYHVIKDDRGKIYLNSQGYSKFCIPDCPGCILNQIVDAAWSGHDPEMSSGNFNEAINRAFVASGLPARARRRLEP